MPRRVDRNEQHLIVARARNVETLHPAAAKREVEPPGAHVVAPQMAPSALLRGEEDRSTVAGPTKRPFDVEIDLALDDAPGPVAARQRQAVRHRVAPSDV